jgi:2-oxoglutarate dehydrogenase E2 component (dihydrolipoamide succinyltransferase)
VRRLAQEYDVDLGSLSGSGSGGRVTREDVERAIRERYRTAEQPSGDGGRQPSPQPARQASQQASSPSEDGRAALEERQRLSRRRQTIAQRLVESQQTAAMLTTFNEVDMSAVMELRRRRKESFQERTGARLGFMSFFAKASIGALKAFPKVNAELQGNELVLKRYYDLGVAVSTDEGLVVPVVRDADRKSFAEIESGIADLAKKARDGKLTLEDLRGGTFTITNGGIFGSLLSTPILTMPQVAILGMHKIQDRPVVVDGEVRIRPMMYVALSYDHRVIDGAEAVSFLVRIKELVEDPEGLLLEG